MLRRPRKFNLFPNPTLSRSAGQIIVITKPFHEVALLRPSERTGGAVGIRLNDVLPHDFSPRQPACVFPRQALAAQRLALRVRRSEEHTSELQSQSNLVCRLL